MDLLTRAEVLGSRRRRYCTVEIPDYGSVRLRSLSNLEMRKVKDQVGSGKVEEALICATLVDETGEPIFDAGDLGVFDEVDSQVMSYLSKAAQIHTGLTFDDDDVSKLKDAVKNSAAAQSNGSPA